jgi:hypothetical protein
MNNNSKYYLPGILMIAIGLLIIAVPEVLAVLAASLLCMFGIAALSLGNMLRKHKVKTIRVENWNSDTDFFDICFERIPRYQNYRRW